MLNTTLRNGLMLLIWLCLIFSVRAEEVPFLAPQQRPQLEANQPWPADRFLVLAYHDVEDDAADQRYLSVRTSALNEQIAWLLHNGYHAISVQDILDAHYGLKSLPPKAFLLSFDDGYSSFYTRVWPLLKAWNVPALWAPVGSWVDTPAGQPVNFGGLMTPRERFATWEMVRELSRSPLVEIGAHTWASHYGLPANPQGSREPAAANRGWDKTTGRYESDAQFTRRMTDDVQKVTAKIHEVAGKTPRAWVWPYGAASGSTLAIAKQQGYQLAFTLNDGLGNVKDLDNIPRLLIAGNPSLKAFASAVTQIQEADPVRVMHVDLDYVYDPNPVQQAKNIDKLVQRVYDMKISHVFLQAFSDPQGDGTVKSLYFPNRWLPMRADLFNFVSWQLQTRGNVKVYAWMPVLAFDLASDLPRVQRWDPQTGKALLARQPYVRLSPWDPRVRQQITDIYEDLARHASFSGILFHDDAVLTDFEDVSPEAVAAWRQTGMAHDAAPVPQRPQERQAWMRFKSQTLTRFTLDLRQAVQAIRGPQVKTARNLFALPILEPQSEA
ncbi:poly-beta-1,6-N-acetyl-D-glucosamine N-deacetylase PgaB, partial [Klebsiella pneumoniae]